MVYTGSEVRLSYVKEMSLTETDGRHAFNLCLSVTADSATRL
jgi:hypothetical protein